MTKLAQDNLSDAVVKHVRQDFAALKVNTAEERGGDLRLTVFQQAIGLFGADYVAGEQDYSGGLDALQQGGERLRHLGSVETDDEELAEIRV